MILDKAWGIKKLQIVSSARGHRLEGQWWWAVVIRQEPVATGRSLYFS